MNLGYSESESDNDDVQAVEVMKQKEIAITNKRPLQSTVTTVLSPSHTEITSTSTANHTTTSHTSADIIQTQNSQESNLIVPTDEYNKTKETKKDKKEKKEKKEKKHRKEKNEDSASIGSVPSLFGSIPSFSSAVPSSGISSLNSFSSIPSYSTSSSLKSLQQISQTIQRKEDNDIPRSRILDIATQRASSSTVTPTTKVGNAFQFAPPQLKRGNISTFDNQKDDYFVLSKKQKLQTAHQEENRSGK